MSTSLRHVTFVCLLLVQLATYHALPTASVPFSLISREANIQPAFKPLQNEIVKLQGNNYTAVPLNDQGYYSRSFKLEPAFKYTKKEKFPAILKRVSEPMSEKDSEKMGSKTHQEIGFLKRETVDLYLFHKWSSSKNEEGFYDVDIIVKDIGEVDPPFKPMHIWYKEDPSIDAQDALFYVLDHIEDTLLWYAKNEHVLYKDHTIRNIFLRKTALAKVQITGEKRGSIDGAVMPIDWGPQGKHAGVVDVANADDAARQIKNYSDTLYWRLEDDFTVEKLAYQLWTHDEDLRREDYYWETYYNKKHPDGVECRHLLIETETDEYDQQVWVYKVVDGVVQDGDGKPIKKYDGYLGHSALLRRGKIGLESEEILRELKKEALELHVEKDTEDVYILYRDTRGLLDEPKQKKQWVEWETVEYAGGSSAAETVQS